MSAVGVITIGQAPRQDIEQSFAPHFEGRDVEIIQLGALDGLPEDYIRAELGPVGDETAYVTKLSSGGSVELAKRHLVPRLRDRIHALETRCEAIVVVCTGDFPMLRSAAELYFPDQLLVRVAQDRGVTNLGLVVPLARQAQDLTQKWERSDLTIHTAVANPYEDGDVTAAAAQLALHSPELVVLDCMGYTSVHGKAARRATESEVIVPQDLVPSYIAQRLTAKRSRV